MATIEALSERLLLVETLMAQQQTRLQSISDQQTIQMQSHQSIHDEIKLIGERKGGSGRPGVVDKLLLPERYSGEKERWRMFSSKLISCLSKAHPCLEDSMIKESGSHRPVTAEKIQECGLTDEAQACL